MSRAMRKETDEEGGEEKEGRGIPHKFIAMIVFPTIRKKKRNVEGHEEGATDEEGGRKSRREGAYLTNLSQ
jgi:hypothetical protein